MKFKYILEGFFKLFTHNDKNEIYFKRYDICTKCSEFSFTYKRCKVCGCFCRAKVLVDYKLDENGTSINGCPLKKW